MNCLRRIKTIAQLGLCLLGAGMLAGCADGYYGAAAPGWSADVNGYYGPDAYSSPDYFGYYDPGYYGYYGGAWAPGFYDYDHHFYHGYHRDFDRGHGFDHHGFAGRGDFGRGHATFGGRGGFARGGTAHGGFARGGGGGHGSGGHSGGRGSGR